MVDGQRSGHWRRWLLAGLVIALAACAAQQEQVRTTFWLEAENDPLVLVDPPAMLASDVTSLVLQGVVIRHQAAFESVADYSIELLRDDGETIVLHYTAGQQRRAPVERGQLVRVRLWQSVAPPLPPLRALTVAVWQPESPDADQLPVLVLQVNGLIPLQDLPVPLRRLYAGDELVYQASERVGGQCHRAVAHHQFALELDDTELALQRDDTTLSPGQRVFLGEGAARLDVALIDNREILQTDCSAEHPKLWAYAATAAPQRVEQDAQQATTVAVPLAHAATPAMAPEGRSLPGKKDKRKGTRKPLERP